MKRSVRMGQTAIGVVGVLGTLACMGSSWTRGLASSLLSVIMESVCPRRSCRSRERRSRSFYWGMYGQPRLPVMYVTMALGLLGWAVVFLWVRGLPRRRVSSP